MTALPCVRCGYRDRQDDRFLCWLCAHDPDVARAVDIVQRAYPDLRSQRAALLGLGWYGGWSTRPHGPTAETPAPSAGVSMSGLKHRVPSQADPEADPPLPPVPASSTRSP